MASKHQNIPKGWRLVELGEFISEIGRRNEDKISNGKPVLSVTNKPGFAISEEFFKRKVFSKDLANYKLIHEGQFAYNPSRVNVGSIARLKECKAGLLSPMYVVFQTNDGLESQYLDYWIQSQRFRNLVKASTQGTVRDSLNFSALEEFPFLLPPISEQEKIVSILSILDSVIEVTQAAIEQIQLIKKGLTQELFTRGIPGRHKKLKKTEIGEIPEKWELVKLKDLLSESIRNGYSPNCLNEKSDYPILALNAVTSEGFNSQGVKSAPATDRKKLDFILKKGDILVSRSNTRDRVGFAGVYEGVPVNCSYPDLLMRIRIDIDKVYPLWVEQCLLSGFGRRYFERNARGTSASMVKIDRKILENFLLGIPFKKEQIEILNIIDVIRQAIQKNKTLLNQFKKTKLSFMMILFTGEVRVKV